MISPVFAVIVGLASLLTSALCSDFSVTSGCLRLPSERACYSACQPCEAPGVVKACNAELCESELCNSYWQCVDDLNGLLQRVYMTCLPVATSNAVCDGACRVEFEDSLSRLQSVWLSLPSLSTTSSDEQTTKNFLLRISNVCRSEIVSDAAPTPPPLQNATAPPPTASAIGTSATVTSSPKPMQLPMYRWKFGEWSFCDCGALPAGIKSRSAVCISALNETVHPSTCEAGLLTPCSAGATACGDRVVQHKKCTEFDCLAYSW